MKLLTLILPFTVLFLAQTAMAHPHVWVTGSASFQLEEKKLARVGIRWQFDAFFSQVLGADFDTNADGTFDQAETQKMKDQVFTSLKGFGYFTHLKTNSVQQEAPFSEVKNFTVGMDNGELVFSFDLVLAEPIDTTTEVIGLSVYDPTIYVDLILDGDEPVVVAGDDSEFCAIEYKQGNEINSQSYFMVPQEVWLDCKSS